MFSRVSYSLYLKLSVVYWFVASLTRHSQTTSCLFNSIRLRFIFPLSNDFEAVRCFIPLFSLVGRQGDYHRYMAEFSEGEGRKKAADMSEDSYKKATVVSDCLQT